MRRTTPQWCAATRATEYPAKEMPPAGRRQGLTGRGKLKMVETLPPQGHHFLITQLRQHGETSRCRSYSWPHTRECRKRPFCADERGSDRFALASNCGPRQVGFVRYGKRRLAARRACGRCRREARGATPATGLFASASTRFELFSPTKPSTTRVTLRDQHGPAPQKNQA